MLPRSLHRNGRLSPRCVFLHHIVGDGRSLDAGAWHAETIGEEPEVAGNGTPAPGHRCLRDSRLLPISRVLVDDEIATGGTIFAATEFLLDHGAKSVQAAIVHPVLSGRAVERLGSSRLSRLIVTNTIPMGADKQSPKIEVLSMAPLLATAITHIHDGRSVSELFS